jgi:hypothetical protein
MTRHHKIFEEMLGQMELPCEVPLADNKTVGPTTLLTFLGLLIDTVNMIVKIPVDKVERLKFGINLILNSNKM